MGYSDTSAYRRFLKKYGIAMTALAIVAVLLVVKIMIDKNGLSSIPITTLLGSLIGGVFFTIGIIFSGAVSDYKESEKIPGEIAVAIKNLYKDSKVIPYDPAKDSEIRSSVESLQLHSKELLSTINSNFKRNVWKLKEIESVMEKIDIDVETLSRKGVAPNLIIKLRSELGNIDRLAHRVDIIMETSFIPAAYTISELAIGAVIAILLFVKSDSFYGGLALFGIISLVLISLILLIKDMDNPFKVNKKRFADVDLSILFNLEEILKKEINPQK